MEKREGRASRRGGRAGKKAGSAPGQRAGRITAETLSGECSERLTACGGLLALVTCVDLLRVEQAFAAPYGHPRRQPQLGGYRLGLGS